MDQHLLDTMPEIVSAHASRTWIFSRSAERLQFCGRKGCFSILNFWFHSAGFAKLRAKLWMRSYENPAGSDWLDGISREFEASPAKTASFMLLSGRILQFNKSAIWLWLKNRVAKGPTNHGIKQVESQLFMAVPRPSMDLSFRMILVIV